MTKTEEPDQTPTAPPRPVIQRRLGGVHIGARPGQRRRHRPTTTHAGAGTGPGAASETADEKSPEPHPTIDRTPSARPVTFAALTAAGLSSAFAALQIALAAGAPFGQHVWDGRSGTAVLSPALRAGSTVAAAVLVWMAAVILARADLTAVNPVHPRRLAATTWAIAGYMAFNTIANLASTSDVERYAFGPYSAAIAVTTAIVARCGPRS